MSNYENILSKQHIVVSLDSLDIQLIRFKPQELHLEGSNSQILRVLSKCIQKFKVSIQRVHRWLFPTEALWKFITH